MDRVATAIFTAGWSQSVWFHIIQIGIPPIPSKAAVPKLALFRFFVYLFVFCVYVLPSNAFQWAIPKKNVSIQHTNKETLWEWMQESVFSADLFANLPCHVCVDSGTGEWDIWLQCEESFPVICLVLLAAEWRWDDGDAEMLLHCSPALFFKCIFFGEGIALVHVIELGAVMLLTRRAWKNSYTMISMVKWCACGWAVSLWVLRIYVFIVASLSEVYSTVAFFLCAMLNCRGLDKKIKPYICLQKTCKVICCNY